MKKMKWIIGVVIVVAIIAWIVDGSMKGIPVTTAKAAVGPIDEYVEERAKTTLPHTVEITMPVSGRIAPITLRQGTPVKKGQEVAHMVPFELESNLKESEAYCEALKNRIKVNQYNAIEDTALKESKDWISTMSALVAVSEKRIKSSQSVATYADDYRDSMVASGQAVSKLKVSQAQMEAAVAKVDVESNELLHNAMKMIQSIFKLAPTYINEYLNRKKMNDSVLESELAANESLRKLAEHDLKRSIMTSPIDGVVLKRYFSNERVLAAGELLLELGDLTQLQVTADILSQDVVDVKTGDPVEIFGPAIGANPVKGKVNRVDPQGFTKISSLGVEQQRVNVIVDFDENVLSELLQASRSFGVDYRVQVKIITASKSKALTIPRTALFRGEASTWQVFKNAGGKAELTTIKVGLINDQRAEVLDGLSEGDSIVLAPPASLVDGNRISPVKN